MQIMGHCSDEVVDYFICIYWTIFFCSVVLLVSYFLDDTGLNDTKLCMHVHLCGAMDCTSSCSASYYSVYSYY